MNDLNIKFPLDDFEELISQIGWSSLEEWFMFWNLKKEILLIDNFLAFLIILNLVRKGQE